MFKLGQRLNEKFMYDLTVVETTLILYIYIYIAPFIITIIKPVIIALLANLARCVMRVEKRILLSWLLSC